MSFLDAFLSYNQMLLYESDRKHMSLVTDKGLYCYIILLFGLKNGEAMYQKLIIEILQGKISNKTKVYIDDMIVKSRKKASHLKGLEDIFT